MSPTVPLKEEKAPMITEPQLDKELTPAHRAHLAALGPAAVGRSASVSRFNSIRRTFSRMSKRSYISNLSSINRKNLARFGRSKITFLVLNTLLTLLGIAVFLFAIFTWTGTYDSASLLRDFRLDLLIVTTVLGLMILGTSVLGFVGALMHKKPILIIFLLILVPTFILNVVTGYLAYKERNSSAFSVKLTEQWESFTVTKREFIQERYNCCGLASIFDRPVLTDTCKAATTPITSTTNSAAGNNSTRRSVLSRRAVLEKRQDPIVPIGAVTPTVPANEDPDTPGVVAPVSPTAPVPSSQPFAPNESAIKDIPAQQVIQTPGCQATWGATISQYLYIIYTVAFSTLPLYLFGFIVGVLATNHIYD